GWTAKGGQYFSVSDTGPGIPESEIPVVLSSFGQGTIAINNAEQGTGLGLTIVQALLNMHQGKFDLKSKLRIGTEAIAYLPKERVTTKQSHPSIVTPDGIVEGEEQCAVA
ncbi:MAG: ATP-binding protein, partial [Pseudomonadota bacterium]